MGRLLREPLTTFVIVSCAIFAFDAWFADYERDTRAPAIRSSDLTATPIVINDAVVAELQENFVWLHGRAPDQAELDLLIQGWIADEVVFREGLAQQMHITDAKVRALIIDKVRLLWSGMPAEPTETDLLNYYIENIGQYYTEPRVSFEQVFFSAPRTDGQAILGALRAGQTVTGDGFWLGDRLENYSQSILRNNLGMAFYQTLVELPPEVWHGPIESTRGQHFVRMLGLQAPAPLPYEAVRARLTRDWIERQRASGIAAQTMAIMARHEIVWDPAQ